LARRLDKCLLDEKKAKNYALPLDGDWKLEGIMQYDEALCLDVTIFGNIVRFLNHRCEDVNLLNMFIMIETRNLHSYHVHVYPYTLTFDFMIFSNSPINL
jgi:hypothetical protein